MGTRVRTHLSYSQTWSSSQNVTPGDRRPDSAADGLRPAGLQRRPSNLPQPPTSFIGRSREIREVGRLLASTRLLTLIGVGGCGKTRLALEAATIQADTFEDGVCWVDLVGLSGSALVIQTVAQALDLREAADESLLETLTHTLKAKRLLLALDNCEHLLAACRELVEALLLACPNLQVLATSREPLAIAGELSWLVPALSMPEAAHLLQRDNHSSAELTHFDAIRLFVERAQSVLPTFTLTNQNEVAVVQVCQRLDGMPLAIELAAARVNVLTVQQIAARLDDRLALLTEGNRTALIPRHQTLRAAMDWSYDLLSEQERILFRRLSVFSGGFALEAVEAIGEGGGIQVKQVLDLLSHLVDKSLVVADTQARSEARYRLLETIRQYALEKLQESGEEMTLRRRHCDWFLALAEQADRQLRGPHQVVWLERLEMEHDNVRAGLVWSLAHEHKIALQLASVLAWFWRLHNHFSEGRRWLEMALTVSHASPATLRIKALTGNGLLAFSQGDTTRATTLLEESLALSRNQNDNWGIAWSLHGLGRVASFHDAFERAVALLEESLTLFRELGDTSGYAYSLYYLGIVARYQGDYARAAALLEESLSMSRATRDTWLIAWILIHMGQLACTLGDYPRAVAAQQESLILCEELKTAWGMAACLESLARVAQAQAMMEGAVRLFSAGAALRDRYGLAAIDLGDLARTRKELSRDRFAAAWAEGQAMTLEQAIREASNVASPIKDAAVHDPALVEPLNERERGMLRLIADGLSNHEIAERLVISLSTVKWHINNLFGKLDVHSRTQATARAKELGLL